MIALLRTPARRIMFAVAVSALVHALLLWLPDIRLPQEEAPLPLLTAKLVPLPKQAARPAPHKPRKAAPPEPSPVLAQAASSVPEATPPASAVEAASAVPAETLAAQSAPAAADNYAMTGDNPPVLPKHAQLRFLAYLGAHGLYVGEIRHRLEIKDSQYALHAELETTGLARLFKRYRNIQDSHGAVLAPGGLRPDEFTETKSDGSETERSAASFDWTAHQLGFASGNKVALPDGAQDILSFLYQLSQLPLNLDTIPLAISNGRKLERYRLMVGAEEDIYTPMGKLHTLHLRKQRGPNEEGLEIWLGMEYRLLPVKFRQIERNGDIGGEIVIKEIRVADE